MDWYYASNGQQAGPVSQEQLAELFRNGTVKPFDLVWNETMTEWTPIGKLADFASAAPVPVSAPAPAAPPLDTPPPMSSPMSAASEPPVFQSAPPYGSSMGNLATNPGKIDGLAIASLVLGLLTPLCCGFFTGIPAIICGHISLSKCSKNPNLQGKGMAIAGLILGYVGTIGTILYFLFFGGMAAIEEIMNQTQSGQMGQ
jgi:peptidyl-prolyl cis-trans isomerase B (cyclophilin B)